MLSVILLLLVPAAIVVGLVAVVSLRALQMKRLAADGIAATATVADKLVQGRTGSGGGRIHRIRYEYVGPDGVTHTHRSVVDVSEWNAVQIGDAYPIYYSASKPSISAPARLVELSRGALARRGR
ncbi:MAG: DUF3592 domain-containing protein [Gemmatimonadaceae bacterium]|jgi:hypothetical protein|nr:DUF3592 domain-containing protein [Gemmatimonadaceae bacterium]